MTTLAGVASNPLEACAWDRRANSDKRGSISEDGDATAEEKRIRRLKTHPQGCLYINKKRKKRRKKIALLNLVE